MRRRMRMKKNSNWKRALALGLTLCMTVSMTACTNSQGGEADDGKGGKGGKGSASADPYANAQLAKEGVYHYKEIGLEAGEGGDLNIVAVRKDGDYLELLTSQYVWNDDYSGQKLNINRMKKDGTDVTTVDLILPDSEGNGESGEMPEGGDGPVTILDQTAPVPAGEPDETDNIGEDYIGDDDYIYDPGDYHYESSNYGQAVLSKNFVFVFQNHYIESYDNENDQYITEEDQALCCWDKEGNYLWKTPIDMKQYQNDDSYSYISSMIALDDETVGVLMAGDKNGMFTVSSDGTVSELKKANSDKDIFSNNAGYAATDDGKLIVSYYSDDWMKQYITVYDPKTGSLGQEYEVPAKARMNGFYSFAAGDKYDVLYSNNDGVYGFNFGDQDVTKVMDFVNSDLATYGLNNMVSIDQDNFIATYYDQVDYTNILCLFTYVKPEDVKDKKTLVLACVGTDSDVKTNVIRFNKESDEYRITIRDYYEVDENYDSSQSYTRLNNDMIAGNIPDILLVNSSIPMDSYVAKGLFANVDELIKNDEELSGLEFFDNVFEAYRVNGVLYQVIPKFTVNTCIAKKSLVGDRSTWTMDEVKQAASKLTGKKMLFGNDFNRDTFMNYMVMRFCGSDFVDLKSGQCKFDTKLFEDFLEYAKTLPAADEESGMDDDYWEEYWNNYYTQFRNNQTLMYQLSIGNISNMVQETKGMFGEEIAYIGFPTESDCGSYIEVYNSYAISSKSANQEGAWKFLRFFLTQEYQENKDYKYGYSNGLPILKSMVRSEIDKLKERPYWEDEDGTKNYYDYTMWTNGESITLDPFTQAEADQLYDFICSVTKPAYYDENVINIVTEEAGSFFAGSKPAKDVAAMIQNRVQLYVNENQ